MERWMNGWIVVLMRMRMEWGAVMWIYYPVFRSFD